MKIRRLRNLIQAIPRPWGRKEQARDAEEMSDLSHDDAWLDAQMRAFFRAEYGKAGPPNDISVYLVQAIRRYHEKQNSSTSGFKGTLAQWCRVLGQVPSAIYKVGSRPDTNRLLSGSMVAALLVMAMGPKIVQSLGRPDSASYATYEVSSDQFWSSTRLEKAAHAGLVDMTDDPLADAAAGNPYTPSSSQPAISPGFEDEQHRLFLERITGEDFDALTPQQQNDLHPVERGLGPRNTTTPIRDRNRSTTIQS